MPLIVLTGVPSSGKTTRTKQLKEFFLSKGKEVFIVSEYEEIVKAKFMKNAVYQDSSKEKHIRGLLKSQVLKHISSSNVVIFDGLNYIKGYRYELFCGTKANKSTQCTVLTQINYEEAWMYNEKRVIEEEKYDRPTFDALIQRYEEPDGKNRWDAPLFVVFPTSDLEFDDIYACLFNKAPPPPNMSTQNAPLSSTNFLYDLDKTTKGITDELIKLKNVGAVGDVKVPGYEDMTVNLTRATAQRLLTLRRQYVSYSKSHKPDPEQIPQLFIQYLTTSLK